MGIIMVYKPTNTGWWLGTMEFYDVPLKVGNGIIIPTDERFSFFREVGIPPTSLVLSVPHNVLC